MPAKWTETIYQVIVDDKVISEYDNICCAPGDYFDPGGIHPHYQIRKVTIEKTITTYNTELLHDTKYHSLQQLRDLPDYQKSIEKYQTL